MERHRDRINAIDDQILELLNQRAEVVLQIAEQKRKLGLPVVNIKREAEVLERLSLKNTGPLSQPSLQKLYQTLFAEMRQMQQEIG